MLQNSLATFPRQSGCRCTETYFQNMGLKAIAAAATSRDVNHGAMKLG